jgi:oligopeptide/dipeptide ABC transporter ATP-binding protein
LDVTIQAQIMDLLEQLKEQRRMATLLITHDLGIVAETADKVAIMNAGLIMEYAPTADLFCKPTHPYTQGLLACIPRLGDKRRRLPIIAHSTRPGKIPVGQSFLDRLSPPFAPVRNKLPPLVEVEPNHFVRCWRD